jgi:phosphotransferase system  glucose/maltose/N-acetylglucosamine-specific IIC component
VYREQEYVERCHCNEPASSACSACGRARCALHLEGSLCNRCTQYIGRELSQGAQQRFVLASASGTVWAFGALVMGSLPAMFVGLPLAVGMFFGLRHWRRKRLVKLMGPALSASRGELPPAPEEPTFPDAPPPRYGPY